MRSAFLVLLGYGDDGSPEVLAQPPGSDARRARGGEVRYPRQLDAGSPSLKVWLRVLESGLKRLDADRGPR